MPFRWDLNPTVLTQFQKRIMVMATLSTFIPHEHPMVDVEE
jgi:hypothetical protein